MASNIALKQQVLAAFKKLHRARTIVFSNDIRALDAARKKINDEFRKNKRVQDEESVRELVKFALEVENELLTTVAQIEEVESGKYSLHLRPGIRLHDNTPFKECPNG